ILIPIAAPPSLATLAGGLYLRRRGCLLLCRSARLHGQVPFAIAHRQRSVQPLFYPHGGSAQPTDDPFPLDLIELAIHAKSLFVLYFPLSHLAKGGRQIVPFAQGTMAIIGVCPFPRQSPPPPPQIVLPEVLVRLFQRLHSRHAHPFHQPILGRLE